MSELAIREERNELALTTDTFSRLALWAEAAGAAHDVAIRLVQTSFVPEAFRGKPGEATAAILAGAELGFDPMASLRAFDVIQGTAAPRANTLRAVVQSKGHEILLVESTQTRAKVRGRRKGESTWQESIWTIERAQKMALTGKHNWKVQPQAMLVARATAECARLIASDAILGIPYASEELDDDMSLAEVAQAETKPARRTAKRAQVEPITPPEPEFEDDATPVSAVPVSSPPADELITKPQLTKLHMVLTAAGYTDRAEGLAYLSQEVGRDVTTSKELTKREAIRVIDGLETPAEPTFDDDTEGGADDA